MKRIKQVNGYIIKQYTPNSPYYSEENSKNGNDYNVFKNGIYLEANLTLEQAIEFCKEN